MTMTSIESVPWPSIRIFSEHVLPSPHVRLGTLHELADVRYQASNLAHRSTKNIDPPLGSSWRLAFSVIAVWWASESTGFSETILLDSTLRRHPEDSTESNRKTADVA
jgi:hypothetical protein